MDNENKGNGKLHWTQTPEGKEKMKKIRRMKRGTKQGALSARNRQKAVDAILAGVLTASQASEKYDVPRSLLYQAKYEFSKRKGKHGRANGYANGANGHRALPVLPEDVIVKMTSEESAWLTTQLLVLKSRADAEGLWQVPKPGPNGAMTGKTTLAARLAEKVMDAAGYGPVHFD